MPALKQSQGSDIKPITTELPIPSLKQRGFLKTPALSSRDEMRRKLNSALAILDATALHGQDLEFNPSDLAAVDP